MAKIKTTERIIPNTKMEASGQNVEVGSVSRKRTKEESSLSTIMNLPLINKNKTT
jgi:hypothetical protein